MNETHPSIEQIVDYLHGELSAPDDAAIHAHLAGCPSCDERRSDEVAITEMLRAHARAGERDLPGGVVAKIRHAVAQPSAWERLRAGLRPVFALPVAVAAAIVLYLGFGTRHATAATTIDARLYVDDHAALAATEPFADAPVPAELTSDNDAR
jgi:anti-sigma factor RsiW